MLIWLAKCWENEKSRYGESPATLIPSPSLRPSVGAVKVPTNKRCTFRRSRCTAAVTLRTETNTPLPVEWAHYWFKDALTCNRQYSLGYCLLSAVRMQRDNWAAMYGCWRGNPPKKIKDSCSENPPLILPTRHRTATTDIVAITAERFVLFWKLLGGCV